MQEDFLHYIWQFKKFELQDLKTTANEDVVVKTVGSHNQNAGPDFFNAQLYIGEQLWAGNVEIHLKSSDWFVHHHENDKAYDNVILHVVWEHDTPVFRKNNTDDCGNLPIFRQEIHRITGTFPIAKRRDLPTRAQVHRYQRGRFLHLPNKSSNCCLVFPRRHR